jgi:hypothetical protein
LTLTAARRAGRAGGWRCAFLTAAAAMLAAAAPAQADSSLYLASSGSGEVFQYGLDVDGSLPPLSEPTVARRGPATTGS